MAKYKVSANDNQYEVEVIDSPSGGATVRVEGQEFQVEPVGGPPPVQAGAGASAPVLSAAPAMAAAAPALAPAGANVVVAPIPGVVTSILVAVGDQVSAGQIVIQLEAMKMENDISTAIDGVVKEIPVSEGAQVSDGQALIVLG